MPRLRTCLILSLIALLLVAGVVLALWLNVVPAALQAPRLGATQPKDGAVDILPTTPITLTFTAPMDTQTAEPVRLKPHVAGRFEWRDAQTLVFIPGSTLPVSRTITVRVSGTAHSWLQRPLQGSAAFRFTTLTRPAVIASTPAPDARYTYIPDQLTITFNRPLDPEALAAGLSITPALAQQHLTWQGSTLQISGFFVPRTRYTIRIAAATTDAAYGIALDRDWVWDITTGEQYPNLSILNRGRVLNLPADQPLSIPIQLTNVSRLDVQLFSLAQPEFEANRNAPYEAWSAFRPSGGPLKIKSAATNAALDQYTRFNLMLDALAPGVYWLEITSPEGPRDVQLLQLR